MGSTARTLALTLALLIGLCALGSAAQLESQVAGSVVDESGGLLPGVAVVVSDLNGRVLGTTVTDAVGRYAVGSLPAGTVRVAFQLDGFSPAAMDVTVRSGAVVQLTQRLTLAQQVESLTVIGHLPAEQPAAPPPPPTPPPPPPVVVPIVEHDRDSVCGPAKASAVVETFGTIRSRMYGLENAGVFAAGDQLVVDGGTLNGIEIGQNFAARRTYRPATPDTLLTAEHTAGVVQVVSAEEATSTVVVIYACDELMRGDTLALFKPERTRPAEPAGTPAYDDAARILFADRGQILGSPRRLMVIDRGEAYAIRAGQRLTLFRRARLGAAAPTILGDAVVVAVRGDSATIRVEHATDVIAPGDWAAPQRYATPVPTGGF